LRITAADGGVRTVKPPTRPGCAAPCCLDAAHTDRAEAGADRD
jgi:hypothetical protein